VAEWLAFLLRFRKVPGSKPDRFLVVLFPGKCWDSNLKQAKRTVEGKIQDPPFSVLQSLKQVTMHKYSDNFKKGGEEIVCYY
jgi:hypothetical protein